MARIFLATLGGSPAVITESLWALQRRPVPWVPDRIEVVTTGFGARRLRAGLLVPGGPLETVLAPVPPLRVFVPVRDTTSDRVRAVSFTWDAGTARLAEDGPPDPGALEDVDDEEAAACMGDLILDRVHAVTRDGRNQLHLSITGGRKTMSAHALFSLGLVGNRQDEASHVLIGRDFDENRQFWHPDQTGGLIHSIADQIAHRDKVHQMATPTLDPRDAAASLRLFSIAAFNFDAVPESLRRSGTLPRLSVIIDQMNLASEWRRAPRMVLDVASNTATIAGQVRILDPEDFVMLRLLAVAAAEGWTCDRDAAHHTAGAVTAARLIFGKPRFGRLDDLRRWMTEALTAAQASQDAATKRAGERTDQLGVHGKKNLRSLVASWKATLTGPGEAAAKMSEVAVAIIRRINYFGKLRAHLAEEFGKPLADELLPELDGRKGRDENGIPQVAFRLGGAVPGFLTVTGETP